MKKSNNIRRIIEKMVDNELKLVNEDINNEKELIKEIKNYKKMEAEISEKQKLIEAQTNEIKKLEKANSTAFSNIEKYMTKFNISKQTANDWIAELEEVLKYKVPRPDYRAAYEEALDKLNAQTRKVLEDIVKQQIETKKTMKDLKLSINKVDEGVFDVIKKMFNGLKSLFKNTIFFGKIVDKLPKIKK